MSASSHFLIHANMFSSKFGVALLVDRAKDSVAAALEVAAFLKRRAQLDEEFSRGLGRLARSSSETFSALIGSSTSSGSGLGVRVGRRRAGDVAPFLDVMGVHDHMASAQGQSARAVQSLSERLTSVARDAERKYKLLRDTNSKHERHLADAETAAEKARARLDVHVDEYERLRHLLGQQDAVGSPEGDETLMLPDRGGKPGKKLASRGIFGSKARSAAALTKQADDVRAKLRHAGEIAEREARAERDLKQTYFDIHLPQLVMALLDATDQVDRAVRETLDAYVNALAQQAESTSRATSSETNALPALIQRWDETTDAQAYLALWQSPSVHARKEPKEPKEGRRRLKLSTVGAGAHGQPSSAPVPLDDMTTPMRSRLFGRYVFAPVSAPADPVGAALERPIFGVDLTQQMARDEVDVPSVLALCITVIEKRGLDAQGLYRQSGAGSRVVAVKRAFDSDMMLASRLLTEEAETDVHTVTSVLKLWLRELPEPLIPSSLYQGFIDAARIPSPRLRYIRIHERVNELPDAHYATLKILMAHLALVASHAETNQMTAANLAIVWGPTLCRPPLDSGSGAAPGDPAQLDRLSETPLQNRAVETIIEYFRDIFVHDDDDETA